MARSIWLSPFILLALAACSQVEHEPEGSASHGAMADSSMAMAGDSPATQGYKSAMTGMMKQLPAFTGNADTDFMAQMRVHHQSAIDMATVELAHGRDPEARALAQTIIDAQKAEIAQISTWLEKPAR